MVEIDENPEVTMVTLEVPSLDDKNETEVSDEDEKGG
jgi:hypothetical protein